jgi:hypothetical protein
MQLKPSLGGSWRSRRAEPPLYSTISFEIAEPRHTPGYDELAYSDVANAIAKFLQAINALIRRYEAILVVLREHRDRSTARSRRGAFRTP